MHPSQGKNLPEEINETLEVKKGSAGKQMGNNYKEMRNRRNGWITFRLGQKPLNTGVTKKQ